MYKGVLRAGLCFVWLAALVLLDSHSQKFQWEQDLLPQYSLNLDHPDLASKSRPDLQTFTTYPPQLGEAMV